MNIYSNCRFLRVFLNIGSSRGLVFGVSPYPYTLGEGHDLFGGPRVLTSSFARLRTGFSQLQELCGVHSFGFKENDRRFSRLTQTRRNEYHFLTAQRAYTRGA